MVVLLLAGCDSDYNPENLRSKREWSVLQGLEWKYRNQKIADGEIVQIDEYRCVSIISTKGIRIWILLNPEHPPYYKQMPSAQFKLTKAEFDLIVKKGNPTQTVIECLSSHVE